MDEINGNVRKSDLKNQNQKSMINKECDIVKDLIPLYLDDVASEGSRELVENHIKNCKECKHEIDISKSPILRDKEIENSVKYIKAFKENKKRQKRAFYIENGIYIFVALFVIFMISYIYRHVFLGDVYHVKVEIGSSKEYSKSELKEASEAVKKYFQKHYKECKLVTLTYDEEDSGERTPAKGEIVFMAEFKTRSWTNPPFEPDRTYSGYSFTVRYDENKGKWEVIDAGYG